MRDITRTVRRFLKRKRIRFYQNSTGKVFNINYAGSSGCFFGCVAVDEEIRAVYVRTFSRMTVPDNKTSQVVELLMRINCNLVIGSFEFCADTGEIACRTSIILGESNLHNDIMEHLLRANWWAMDKYYPAINAVVFGDVSPEQAIDKIEKQLQADDQDHARPEGPFGGRLGDALRGSMN